MDQRPPYTGEAGRHARQLFSRVFSVGHGPTFSSQVQPTAEAFQQLRLATPLGISPNENVNDVVPENQNSDDDDEDINVAFPRNPLTNSNGRYQTYNITSQSMKVPMELRNFNLYFGQRGEMILPRKPSEPGWFSYWSATFIDALHAPATERLPWQRPDPRLRSSTRSDFELLMRMFDRLEKEHFEIALRWVATQHHRLIFDGTDMDAVPKPGMYQFLGVAERLVLESSNNNNKNCQLLIKNMEVHCEQVEHQCEDLERRCTTLEQRCTSLEADLKAAKRRNVRHRELTEDLQLKYESVRNAQKPNDGQILPLSEVTESRLEHLKARGMAVEARINVHTRQLQYTITVADHLLPLLAKEMEFIIRDETSGPQ